jgi:hypothetical protein
LLLFRVLRLLRNSILDLSLQLHVQEVSLANLVADPVLVNAADEIIPLTGIDLSHIVLVLDERFTAEEDFGTVFAIDELAVLDELVEVLTGSD